MLPKINEKALNNCFFAMNENITKAQRVHYNRLRLKLWCIQDHLIDYSRRPSVNDDKRIVRYIEELNKLVQLMPVLCD